MRARIIRRVRRETRRRDAQLVDSEPDQQRQRLRVAGRLAADIDRDTRAVGGSHGARDQAEDGGVVGHGACRSRGVLTIRGQGVLDEVVGADREEVAAARDRRRR